MKRGQNDVALLLALSAAGLRDYLLPMAGQATGAWASIGEFLLIGEWDRL